MTTHARVVVGQRAEERPGPQPGPQTDAIAATWCEELFYGGAAFGGKTEYLLLDFLQDVERYGKAWRGILFRKSYTDLEEIIERSRDMFVPTGAEYQAAPHWRWTWPNGATLRFRYMESPKDMMRWQGQAFCVAVGTPIRMEDGSFRPIERIEVGDYVATLEGPRRVTARIAAYQAPCVEALVYANGTLLGVQTHPVWHPILAFGGWFSWSEGVRSAGRASWMSRRAPWQPPALCVPVVLHAPTAQLASRHSCTEAYQPTSPHAPYRSGWLSSESMADRIARLLDRLRRPERKRSGLCPVSLYSPNAYAYAQPGTSRAPDWRNRSPSVAYCDDGHARLALESVPDGIPSPDGAASPFHKAHKDASDTTHRHSHRVPWSYRHPYSGEERYPSEAVCDGSLLLSPCGDRMVCDLTVEGANHYISASGLVNKNTWIGWDELTQWATDRAYRYLRARLRVNASLGIDVPTKRIRATANPGGPGHHWVKARWVTPNPSGYAVRECEETGHKLLFIPAKIRDNPIGLSADPEYANRLKGLGSPELVRAWLDGDWNIVEGAYFDCWSASMVLRPVTLPADWLRFRSCDWGSASPFAVHWWAVVQDDWRHLDGAVLPRGALICYREWYGSMNPADEGQRGLKLTAEELAEGIVRRERGDKLAYGVIDPAAFTEDGGPSKAERINNVLSGARMVGFHAADNRRVASVGKQDAPRGPIGGWDQLRARMKGIDGTPMIYTFDTCVAAIRTIPALQHDPNRPEDLDTAAEDHCGDSWRYAAMSRPWMPARKVTLTVHDGYRAANESNNERWMHI